LAGADNTYMKLYTPTIIGSLMLVLFLTGCGNYPVRETNYTFQQRPILAEEKQTIVYSAMQLIGTPYRFGGTNNNGVDCSGLVYLAYQNAGIQVPRTSLQQFRHSDRVHMSQLQPGDLVFFKLDRSPVSHVGIYIGDDRFIHAPRTGKFVEYASLDNSFWKERLTGAGRF